jgi:hypothetical protein
MFQMPPESFVGDRDVLLVPALITLLIAAYQ